MSESSDSLAILVKALVGDRHPSQQTPAVQAPSASEESRAVRVMLAEEDVDDRKHLLPIAPASVKLFAGSATTRVVETQPAPAPPQPSLEEFADIEERRAVRYTTLIPLPGQFDGTEVRIKDLSSSGFQIEHAERIPLRTSRMLRFVHPRSFDANHRSLGIPDRLFESHYTEFRCTTVWSRLHRETNNSPAMYRTGVTTAPGESGPLLLPFLLREYLQPDSEGLARKQKLVRQRKERLMARSQELADQHLLVRTAFNWLRTHPSELFEWRRRARFALSAGTVPHADNFALGYTVEVVAVWQFLGFSIGLPTIKNALTALSADSQTTRGLSSG